MEVKANLGRVPLLAGLDARTTERIAKHGTRRSYAPGELIIRQGDPAVLAALCLELLSPRAFQNLARAVGGDPEAVAEHVVRFVLGGLAARTSTPGA